MKNLLVAVIVFIPMLLCSLAHAVVITSLDVKDGQMTMHMDNYGERYDLILGERSNWASAAIIQIFEEKRFARIRRDYQEDFSVLKFKNFGVFYEFSCFISQNFQNLGECRNKAGDKCVSYVWFLP